MNDEEKERRREELRKKSEEIQNELDETTAIDEETLNRKIGDLTVGEFLEIFSSTGGTSGVPQMGDMGDMMKMSMDLMKNNPDMIKQMMKMFSRGR